MTQPRLLGDRYELEGVVGRGGMAEVYRARDLRLERIVAIKTLRTDLARDQTFQARFRREAQSSASLNNPSIVAVYDTGEDMSTGVPVPFIVMEYVDGRTLRDLLIEGHRLTPERTLEVIDGVLTALEYSHQAGIVHRDIKPGNVMVTRNGQSVKVMDFGIARAMNDAQATMTQTAQVIGTAQYLSPEQARGERVDSRSDLYSTGCMMYELLTGRPPFQGDSPVAIAYQHVRENPIPPSQLDPSLPAWADAIVLKAMAKAPSDRYQSAAEFQADIRRAGSGMRIAAAAPQPMTRLDYYDPRTQQMGPQTAMGGSPTALQSYQQSGYPTGYQQATGYQQGYNEYGQGGDGYGDADSRGGRRKWLPWLISGIVILAAIIVAVIMLHSNSSGTYVPDLGSDVTWTSAQQQIASAGLKADEVKQYSSTVQSGYVIKTNPGEGDSIAKGGTVTVYVSEGAQDVTFSSSLASSLVGLSPTAAESALTSAGFTGTVSTSTDSSSSQSAGDVDHTSLTAGNSYPPSTPIVLYVSAGGVAVQSVIGFDADDAYSELSEDFDVTTTYETDPTATATPGTVWSQAPSPGSTEPTGSPATIYVEPTPSPTASASAAPSATPSTGVSPSPSSSSTGTGNGFPF